MAIRGSNIIVLFNQKRIPREQARWRLLWNVNAKTKMAVSRLLIGGMFDAKGFCAYASGECDDPL
jgi:hypothetical protein